MNSCTTRVKYNMECKDANFKEDKCKVCKEIIKRAGQVLVGGKDEFE